MKEFGTCSASGTSFGIPLGNVGGDPGVYEAREDDSSRLETDREEGEARNGSQGLATRGLSESSSPNIDCRCEYDSVVCSREGGDMRSRLCRRFGGGNSKGYSRNH